VNLLPQSIFRPVECRVGDHQVCDLSTPTYPYKAFIETHLGFTKDQKTTMFENLEYYSKDTPNAEEIFVLANSESFKKRHAQLKANEGKLPFSITSDANCRYCFLSSLVSEWRC